MINLSLSNKGNSKGVANDDIGVQIVHNRAMAWNVAKSPKATAIRCFGHPSICKGVANQWHSVPQLEITFLPIEVSTPLGTIHDVKPVPDCELSWTPEHRLVLWRTPITVGTSSVASWPSPARCSEDPLRPWEGALGVGEMPQDVAIVGSGSTGFEISMGMGKYQWDQNSEDPS